MTALGEALALAGAHVTPPRGEAEVAALEERLGVSLPGDYRAFLADVGTSCPQGPPGYGLWSPWDPTRDLDEGERSRDPARPFPLTELWAWGESYDEDAEQAARVEAVWSDGWIWLGTDGCGMHCVLVTAGDARGQVWELNEMGALPYRGGASFSTWMEDWLTGGPVWLAGKWEDDWLAAFERPVARVERAADAEGGERVRAWLRDPYDGRDDAGTCGWVEQLVDADGRDAAAPVGEWTKAVAPSTEPLRMTPAGARLLWQHVREEALSHPPRRDPRTPPGGGNEGPAPVRRRTRWTGWWR